MKAGSIRKGPYKMDGIVIIGSMDVEAYYPNMDVLVVAKEAKKEVMESSLTIEGVNMDEVALFIACSMNQCEIEKKF